MNISTVEVKNVTKCFDGHYVLVDVAFKINKGCILTIVGPNGSGKTTLAKITAGLLNPTKGRIVINGEELSSSRRQFQSQIGLVIHETLLYEDLTTLENLKFYARLYGTKNYERQIKEILATIGLEHKTNHRTKNLSRGMHQRLAIGRSMIPNPDFYIFDEPFTNLDFDSTNAVVEIIKKLRDKGKLVLLTTHNLEIASNISDQILILHNGKICKALGKGTRFEDLEKTYIDLTSEIEPGIIT